MKLKILSFFVSIMLVFGAIIPVNAAFSDVKSDSTNYKAIDVLSSLKLLKGYEDGTFGPEKVISRAEFAAVICRVLGQEETSKNARVETKFSDVPAEHWSSGYISFASNSGIVNGMGDGTFLPSEPVKFEQAVKMIVCALGYKLIAESKGGYPTGYISVAVSEGILRNVNGSAGNFANRGIVAKMVYNSLELPIMEQTNFGKNENYEKVDQTFLKKIKVKKVEGVVTNKKFFNGTNLSNDQVTLKYKETDIKDGKIVYSDEKTDNFKVDDLSIKNYLGQSIEGYVLDDGDTTNKLISVTQKPNNKTIKIKSSDYIKLDNSTLTLSYYTDKDNDKKEEVTVDLNATLAKDQKFLKTGSITDADINIFAANSYGSGKYKGYGFVNIIDNNDDGKYDFIFVDAYKDYYVNLVEPTSYRIDDRINGFALFLDPTKSDRNIEFYYEGRPVDFSMIAKGDIISISGEITNNELINGKVQISKKILTGAITEISVDEKTMRVGEQEIDFVGRFDNPATVDYAMGDDGKFYANFMNKIIYKDIRGSLSKNYALLYKVVKEGSISSSIKAKLFTSLGEWKTMDFASSVRIYKGWASASDYKSQTKSSTDDILNALIDWDADGDGSKDNSANSNEASYNKRPVLVTYKVNSSNQINEISYAKDRKTTGTADKDNFSIDLDLSNNTADAYKTSAKAIGNKAYLTDQTIVFNIDTAFDTVFDDTYVSATTANAFSNDSYIKTLLYDFVDGNVAQAMVTFKAIGNVSYSKPVMIVTDVTEVSIDGDSFVKLKGFEAGKKAEITLDNDDVLYYSKNSATNTITFKKGDIILYSKNAKGRANKVDLLFETSTAALKPTYTGEKMLVYRKDAGSTKEVSCYYGYLVDKLVADPVRIGVAPDPTHKSSSSDTKYYVCDASVSVVRYNLDSGSSGSISASDIGLPIPDSDGKWTQATNVGLDGDYVFIRVHDNLVKDIVVFSNLDKK